MGKTARFKSHHGAVIIDPNVMPIGELVQLESETLIVFANGSRQLVKESLDVVEARLREARD